jgi:hypothetical protein
MAGALIALGVMEDVQHEPSQSGTEDSTDMYLTSVDRTATSTSPGPLLDLLGRSPSGSLALRSGKTHESDEYSSDEDLEETSSSDETLVADGGGSGFDSHPHDKDVTLVTDGDEDTEESNSGRVPQSRNDPVMVTDGEESDSDSDSHNDPDESAKPRQEIATRNEEEIRLSRSNGVSVEPRQKTSNQYGEGTHPSRSNEEPMDQQRQKAEAHAKIQQRVAEYMEREEEPDHARAVTAVKRKIKDGQMEDFPSAKRYLMTLADEATEV